MAQIQQRVFMIQIRPCFVKENPEPGYPGVITKYSGKIYRAILGGETEYEVTQYRPKGSTSNITGSLPDGYTICIELPELNWQIHPAGPTTTAVTGIGIERYYPDTKGRMPTNAPKVSRPPFNENGWYSNDPWMLHSTWTSFEECKNYVRYLIDLLGFDGVMVSNFIPLDLELLPNK